MGSRFVFIVSGLFLLALSAFSAGMWSTHKNWLPWQEVQQARQIFHSLRDTGKILPERSYGQRSKGAPGSRYTVFDAAAVAPGFLAITRFDADKRRYAVDLIAPDGTVLHSWPLDFSKIVPGSDPMGLVQATKVLPDGSLLASLNDSNDSKALARFDACGDPIWTRTDMVYHHVIQPDPDAEGYWVWQAPEWYGDEDQKLVRFDAGTGETLEQIDLIDEVIGQSAENTLELTIPKNFEFTLRAAPNSITDIFHPNDIEPLPAEMASAFPQFEAGDLLISFRIPDLLAVLDRQTHHILWARYGPWLRQHDPDWEADGTITVFSNNMDRFHSSLIRIDPATGAVQALFENGSVNFDSYIMGVHQHLPNGNWLIVSTMEGRVIEVTADGDPVREYSNIINETYNAIVPNAEYLPEGFFDKIPDCGE